MNPRVLFAFLVMLLMCWFQVRRSENKIPRYGFEETDFRSVWFSWYMNVVPGRYAMLIT